VYSLPQPAPGGAEVQTQHCHQRFNAELASPCAFCKIEALTPISMMEKQRLK